MGTISLKTAPLDPVSVPSRSEFDPAKAARPDKAASQAAARRLDVERATPPWAREHAVARKIKALYREADARNRADGSRSWHVDHIVPLVALDEKTGEHVACGLHVPQNLRIISGADNVARGNRHWRKDLKEIEAAERAAAEAETSGAAPKRFQGPLGEGALERLEVDVHALAALLGVNKRWVQKLADEGHIPRPSSRGVYPLAECLRGWIAYKIQKGLAGAGGGKNDELRAARTEKLRVEIARMRGDLLPRAAVGAAWATAIGLIRSGIRNLERNIAPDLARASGGGMTADEAAAVLRPAINTLLEDLSRAPVYGDDEPIPGLDTGADSPGDGRAGAAA